MRINAIDAVRDLKDIEMAKKAKKSTGKKAAKGVAKKGVAKAKKGVAKSATANAAADRGRLFGLSEDSRRGVAALTAVASSTPPAGIAVDEAERRRIIGVLSVKDQALSEQLSYLMSVRRRVTRPAERSRWISTSGAVTVEQNLCRQRIEELRARTQYRNPGGPEEQRLLNAIRLAGQAAAQTAAFVTLCQRFLDVVAAYKAEDTD